MNTLTNSHKTTQEFNNRNVKTTTGEIETQCKRHNKFLLASFHPSVDERDLECLEIIFVEFMLMLFFISYHSACQYPSDTYRQSGNLVNQRLVSVQLPDVMPDINKHLEQVGRKQSANQRQIDVNIEILNTR